MNEHSDVRIGRGAGGGEAGRRLLVLAVLLAALVLGAVVLGATSGPVATPDVVIAPAPAAATVVAQPVGTTPS